MKSLNKVRVAALSLIGFVAVLPAWICWGAEGAHSDYVSLYRAENYGFRFVNAPVNLNVFGSTSPPLESDVDENTRLTLKYVKVGKYGETLQGYRKFRVFVPPGAFKVGLTLYYQLVQHAVTAKLQAPPEENDSRLQSYWGVGYSGFGFDVQGGYSIEALAKEQKYFDNGGGATQVLNETRACTSEEEAGWLYVWIFDPPSSKPTSLMYIDYYADVKAGGYRDWYDRMETKFQEYVETGNSDLNPWDENGDPKSNWKEILNSTVSAAEQSVGGESGDHEYAFSMNESQSLRLLLNASPGVQPVQEWLYLKIESSDPILNGNLVGFLTPDGMVPLNDIADFSLVTFDGFGSVRDKFPILEYFGLATISPSELGALFGHEATLTYTYAYSTQKVQTYQEFFDAFFNNQINRNSVTIKLTD